ncbi:hypothetical protein G6F61_015019 [Rhizopus arrhizus]|nr:hypothetical protein G6F61_015019 [Rhizopus arrhizus]
MGRGITVLAAALMASLAAGCTPATGNDPAAPATAAKATGERAVATIAEAFLSPMTPADNIDSPAASPGGLRRQHRPASA